ncbi:MAG: hypothetical protein JSV10_00985 [Candidatus Zixiibacteriota bacterium]|nr:MAG: hypothetical protein JSV10_00985 [candidate division Zixibacteria bacterium]
MLVEKSGGWFRVGKKLGSLAWFGLAMLSVGSAYAHDGVETVRAGIRGSGDSMIIPAAFDILLLVGIFACFLISVRVKSFLRDGELSAGWTLFSLSFVLLFAAQLLNLFLTLDLVNIHPSVIASLRVLFIVSLASGIYMMKKVLS